MLRITKENGETEDILLIIKFGKEEHIDSLRKGEIYTNNLKYFIDLENSDGDVGIGDRDEATLLLNDVDLNITKCETGKEDSHSVMFGSVGDEIKFNNTTIKLQLDDHIKMPVFCLLGINKEELKEIGDNYVLKFSESEIDKLKKDFKDYTHALIMFAGPFIKRITEASIEKCITIEWGYVSYYDSSINQDERVRDYKSMKRAFWKKEYFKNQKEFRIAFHNIIDNGKVLINIGDLSDISEKIKISELLDKDYSLKVLTVNFNDVP